MNTKKQDTMFEVAVEWSVCGTVKVKASSLEQALKAAEEFNPTDVDGPCYIDGSWMVNKEMSEHLNLEIDEPQEGE